MKTCVVCKFFPAAAGESICDDCIKAMPPVVTPIPEPVEAAAPEVFPKVDFHSSPETPFRRRVYRETPYRNGRNGRVA